MKSTQARARAESDPRIWELKKAQGRYVGRVILAQGNDRVQGNRWSLGGLQMGGLFVAHTIDQK